MTSSNDATSLKDQWVEDAKARIKNLKKSHTTARYQQELAIETTHRCLLPFHIITLSVFSGRKLGSSF